MGSENIASIIHWCLSVTQCSVDTFVAALSSLESRAEQQF